jgi:hypothetical protein
MENIIDKFKEKITRELSGQPDARRDILKNFDDLKEEKKTHDDFLKDVDSISEIRKLIKNKKLSNNQIKTKIKEFLKDPEELIDFLKMLLNNTKSKKEESKEATTAGGSSGGFVADLGSEPNQYVNKVPTVRESEEYCDSCDRVKSKCVCNTKKTETKEATGAGSDGAYSQPSIWAKSMKKKDFRGYSKPLYKGGKFVQVKKKCKKFPYCNQGDIKALKIFENESVQTAIDSVSSKYGIDKEYIFDVLFEEIRKRQK